MECTTLDTITEDGQLISRPKKQFDTMDDAIRVAKIENAKPEHIYKVAAYKCHICHKYHNGRNGKIIKEKEKVKLQALISHKIDTKERKRVYDLSNLKVVGFIDLSTIRY